MYYRARWYDVQQSRFLSEDPIGFASGDANFYAYVSNNPINAIDPSGLEQFTYTLDSNNKIGIRNPLEAYGGGAVLAPDDPSSPPTNCECNSGAPVEVIIWLPSNGHGPVGLGGHVSYNIDGKMFSWEGGGWRKPAPDARTYIEDNQVYRTGTGYVLDFGSPEANRAFANSIKHAYEGADPLFGFPPSKYPYNLFTNNCGTAFSRALWGNGYGIDPNFAPTSHQQYIETHLRGRIKERRFYWQGGASPKDRYDNFFQNMDRNIRGLYGNP
jgi:hypothetical protein